MHLTWLGHSCFKIQDKIGPEGITIITDPFDKSIGLKPPRLEAQIVTVSHGHYDHNNVAAIKGKPFVVNQAGEYDIKGISIIGVESYHDDKQGAERGKNIIFWLEVDGISIVHLGDLGAVLTEKQIAHIPRVDILLIPVGGKYTIGPRQAVEVVHQLEPRLIIPMHYKVPGLKIDIGGVDPFVKELGLRPHTEEKLKLSRKDLPSEEMELVLLRL